MEMAHQTRECLVQKFWICFECFGMLRCTGPLQQGENKPILYVILYRGG